MCDLGGVIEVVDDDRWLDAWVARWERRAGCEAGVWFRYAADAATQPAGEADAATQPAGSADAGGGAGESDDATSRMIRERAVAALGLSSARADQMIAEFWDAYCGTLDKQLCDFVRGLRGRVITAALSNSADGARREEERRFRLSELFHVLVYSHEVGVEKPDPAIYRVTESMVGVQPHEIVFLDDRQAAVDGALAAGWSALLHRDTTESIEAIRRVVG